MNSRINGLLVPGVTIAIALAAAVAASKYAQGNIEARVTANERVAEKIEVAADKTATMLHSIDQRLSRIEGFLYRNTSDQQ